MDFKIGFDQGAIYNIIDDNDLLMRKSLFWCLNARLLVVITIEK